jgi:hypothetical protein
VADGQESARNIKNITLQTAEARAREVASKHGIYTSIVDDIAAALRAELQTAREALKEIADYGDGINEAISRGTTGSESLSKDLALQLLGLMKKVTAKKVTSQTVNAACNCASEIHKILKLNFEMKRRGL